jgi:glycosyltransferase involved in cell wall biosynthesis
MRDTVLCQLSVIVIVYNKEKEIPLILRGFSRQNADNIDWELIIVDDGSSDNTVNRIMECKNSLPLRLVRMPHEGNRQKLRNAGMNMANGNRIAFLDGDIIPGPDYLPVHAAGADDVILMGERNNTEAFIYDSDYQEACRDDIYMLESYPGKADERNPQFWQNNPGSHTHKWRFMHSHNFSVKGSIVKPLGGFNEKLRYWGADDLELGYRFHQKGMHFEYSRKGGGIHLHHPVSMHPDDYYKNLVIFFETYKDTAIELLFIEYKLSPAETLAAYKECKTSYLQELDRTHIASWQGRVLTNSLQIDRCDRVMGIGIYLDNIHDRYDTYLINGQLAGLGLTIFNLILENGINLADQIAIHDETGVAALQLERINAIATGWDLRKEGTFLFVRKGTGPSPLICEFSKESFVDFNMVDFFRSALKQSLSRKALCYYPAVPEANLVPEKFLAVDKSTEECYPQIKTGPVFMFHRIWESYLNDRYKSPVSVYYELSEKGSYDSNDLETINRVYDLVFFNSREEVELFRNCTGNDSPKAHYLPASINLSLFTENPKPYKQETYEVLAVSRYPKYTNGLIDCASAFLSEFPDTMDIHLTFIISKTHRIEYENAYFNTNKNRAFTQWANQKERILQDDIELNPLFQDKRITVIHADLTQEGFVNRLEHVNAYMDLNWQKGLPYLTLWAGLAGADIILGEHNKPYFEECGDDISPIPVQAVSGYLMDYEMNFPIEGNHFERNALRVLYKPRETAVRKTLRALYDDWITGGRFKNYRNNTKMRSAFDAEKNGSRVIEILKRYPQSAP